ncbi:hypothetical protein Tco_0785429 [Tanacetum coccineum]
MIYGHGDGALPLVYIDMMFGSTILLPFSSKQLFRKRRSCWLCDEVIYSLFAKQSEDLDLLHEDLEQIDDMDIEEMDINWQIAMIAIRMKKFYKKTRRRVRIDGNKPVGLDKKKLELFQMSQYSHFARGNADPRDNDGKQERTLLSKIKELERKSSELELFAIWMMVLSIGENIQKKK